MNTATAKKPVSVPDSAQAVRITGDFSIEALTTDKVETHALAPDEVLVMIKAVSLNFRDLLMVTGQYNPKLQKPLVICSDGAGEVVAVGEQVMQFRAGDRVAGTFFQDWITGDYNDAYGKSALGGAIDGVLATARAFKEHGLVKLPEHLSFEEGATLPCAGVTAWHALVPTAHLKSCDTVLLLGTGGVSIFALQFAKLHGAHVIITSSSDEKLARAKKFGADEVINYKKTPEWDKEVKRLTAKRGVDVVVEVGGAGTLARSLRSVRAGGQVSLIGVLSGREEPLDIAPILHGSIRLQGIYVGSREMFEGMNRAIAQGRIKPVIDRVFSFAEAKDALRHMQSGGHFGKIVIAV